MILRRRPLFSYALLAMPLAFAGLPIYIHAPDFYAVHFNISLAFIGFMLLALRLIDAIQDPLIGVLSDRYDHHRLKIIGGGLGLLTAGFIALFNPPETSDGVYTVLLWMALSIFICTTGYSIVTINMQALGSLWQAGSKEMSRIMGWREAMGLIGLLMGSILPAILIMSYDIDQAYSLLSIIFIPTIIVSGYVFVQWVQKTEFDKPNLKNFISFKEIFKNKPVFNIYIIFLISAVASAIPATLVLFFIRDYLQVENYTGLFLLLYFFSGVIAMPLWQMIAKRKTASFGWLISMILACAVFIGAFFLSTGDIVAYGLICILSGIAIGGDLALPPTIIAEYIKKNNHQNAASQYYAISAFISKLALAIATGIALPLLALYGYQPGEITTNISLPLAYALIPCFIKLISAAMLWRFIKTHEI